MFYNYKCSMLLRKQGRAHCVACYMLSPLSLFSKDAERNNKLNGPVVGVSPMALSESHIIYYNYCGSDSLDMDRAIHSF
jgi:hypothetical protein